ncbi:MAG TPA: hypothetical protein PK992_05840, partial [Planctomycetaceae bacterium]|nr:hypothetical protein [Planctomycetaceae bacterium]
TAPLFGVLAGVLLAIDGGIDLRRDTDYLDPRWNRSTSRSIAHVLYTPSAWLTRGLNPDDQTVVNYCDTKERSVYSLAFGLGRTRPSVPSELKAPPLPLNDYSQTDLQKIYAGWNAVIEPISDDRVRLVVTLNSRPNAMHFTIDTTRHVLLKMDTLNDGKLTNSTTFDEFVELAGSWWAQHVVQTDDQGRITSDMRLELRALNADESAARLNELTAEKSSVQLLQVPFASLRTARQKVADGSASFADRITMILHNAQLQQWDEMWKHVDAAEMLAADKPGVRWMRTVLRATIRRNEDAHEHLMQEARKLLPKAQLDEVFLAEFILAQDRALSSPPEFDDLHQLLEPVYTRSLAERVPTLPVHWTNDEPAEQRLRDGIAQRIMDQWLEREASSLQQLNRNEDALGLRRQIAERSPWDANAQQVYAQQLAAAGEF